MDNKRTKAMLRLLEKMTGKEALLEFRTDQQNKQEFKDVAVDFSKFIHGDYESFVQKLKASEGDPKLLNFLKSGLLDGNQTDEKFQVSEMSIPCTQLIPTQTEIDMFKSLKFALIHAQATEAFLVNPESVTFGGTHLFTFDGTYIIDGHHRWSQLYSVNPHEKIKVLNFNKPGLSPIDMLKATQVAIMSTVGNLHIEPVKGKNLLTASEQEVKEYVLATITEEVYLVYRKHKHFLKKEEIAEYIWQNVKLMQKRNKPIPGAPSRGFMPQTNEPHGNQGNVVAALTKGTANSQAPFVKEAVELTNDDVAKSTGNWTKLEIEAQPKKFAGGEGVLIVAKNGQPIPNVADIIKLIKKRYNTKGWKIYAFGNGIAIHKENLNENWEIRAAIKLLEKYSGKQVTLEEAAEGFTNVGRDEEGHKIGNCTKCGANGVLVDSHKCSK